MKILEKKRIIDIEPEDSMPRNGGDHEFIVTTVAALDNGEQFIWSWSSSMLSFCSISGVYHNDTEIFPVFYGDEPVFDQDGSILELEVARPSWFWETAEEFCVYNICTDSIECRVGSL